MNDPVIHYPHPIDSSYNLCGCVCTRDDPQTTTGENVDCIKCLVLEAEGKAEEL